jgi:hypothetical protein
MRHLMRSSGKTRPLGRNVWSTVESGWFLSLNIWADPTMTKRS